MGNPAVAIGGQPAEALESFTSQEFLNFSKSPGGVLSPLRGTTDYLKLDKHLNQQELNPVLNDNPYQLVQANTSRSGHLVVPHT